MLLGHTAENFEVRIYLLLNYVRSTTSHAAPHRYYVGRLTTGNVIGGLQSPENCRLPAKSTMNVKGTDLFIALRCSVSTQNFACKDRCERRYRRWGFRKDCRGAWEQVDDQRKVERLPDQDLW